MIEIRNIKKSFDGFSAITDLSVDIREGLIYGLLGTNGAGKSTLMRIVTGVTRADEGTVFVDGEPVYDNPAAKEKLFFISDDQYFFKHCNANEMHSFYKMIYPRFDSEKFYMLLGQFELDSRRKVNTFSKGMKKQLAILLGICSGCDYLLCDETFDGLDPVMRQAVKSLFAKELSERCFTPIIASHNLRELEDICDTVGLLHKGGILFSKDLDDLKGNLQKIQCLFGKEGEAEKVKQICEVIGCEKRGSLYLFTIRGTRQETIDKLATLDVSFCEAIPLSLEEIFISETEVVGYDVKKLILEQ